MIQLHPKGKITFRPIVVCELFIAGIMTRKNSLLNASGRGVLYEEPGVRERGKLNFVLTWISHLKSSIQ